MVDQFYRTTADVGRQILADGGLEALQNAARDKDGYLSQNALGQGASRLLWRIRKFAQPGGQGIDALDRSRALKEATDHAAAFLDRNPAEPGDVIPEKTFRLAQAAESQDPDALLRVVQDLS